MTTRSRNWVASLTLAMTAFLTISCTNFKHPFGSNEDMSADTLCYRHAYAKSNPAIYAEIKARRLDCAAIIEIP